MHALHGDSQTVRPQSKIKLLRKEADFFQDFFLFSGPEKGNPEIPERFSERSENPEFQEFPEKWHHCIWHGKDKDTSKYPW